MRRFCIACAFLWLAYPCGALSFHAPQSGKEKAEFQKAQNNLNDIRKIRAKLQDKNLSAAQPADDRKALLLLYNKTIHAVIAAYGISPEHEAGGILVTGKVTGAQSKEWDPVFDNQAHRIMTDKDGKEVLAKESPSVTYTWSDGQITLGPGAFEGSFDDKSTKEVVHYLASPALLASIIIHETVHFEQYTTPGRGDKKGLFEMELEAYKIQLNSARQIGLAPSEVRLIGQGMIKGMKWVKAHPDASPFAAPGAVLGSPDLPDSDIEHAKTGAEDSFSRPSGLLDAIDHAVSVSKNAEATAKKISDNKDRADLERKQEDERRFREWETAQAAAWNYIKAAVGLACSDPDAFSNQIQAGKIVNADIGNDDLWFYLSGAESEVGWESLSKGVNPCQDSIVNQMLSANSPVPASWILTWAKQYRESHPGLIERFTTTLSDFFAALGEFLNSPAPSPSLGQGGSGGGSEEGGGGQAHGSSHFQYHGGRADSQLRGIASGSMNFDGGF